MIAIVGSTELYLPLEEMINLEEERGDWPRRSIKKKMAPGPEKASNTDFLNKAKKKKSFKKDERRRSVRRKDSHTNLSLERLEVGRLAIVDILVSPQIDG